eukprot:180288-Prymnesium_polylepis.1
MRAPEQRFRREARQRAERLEQRRVLRAQVLVERTKLGVSPVRRESESVERAVATRSGGWEERKGWRAAVREALCKGAADADHPESGYPRRRASSLDRDRVSGGVNGVRGGAWRGTATHLRPSTSCSPTCTWMV